MPAKGASRVRTESMIQRLGKKPMQEGFDLWDKDFVLGALRLFQCKLETCPPFEQAPCLEAIGTILYLIDETEEALEHWQLAMEKYETINKAPLVALMKARIAETQSGGGTTAALKVCAEALAATDGGEAPGDAAKQNVGRLLLYRADLHGKEENFSAAIQDCDKAASFGPGWLKAGDSTFHAHFLKASLLNAQDRTEEAIAAVKEALKLRPEHFQSWELLSQMKQKDPVDVQGALDAIEKAFELHNKATLLRDKAFMLSELGKDEEAIKVCDDTIAKPPHEETEAMAGPAEAVGIMYKAKAAILADAGRMDEASAALKEALRNDPHDAEALRMSADVSTTLARDYLQQQNIPQFLDTLISHVLKAKPDNPIAFMVDAIEKNEVSL